MIEKAFKTAEAEFKSACLVDVKAFVDAATSLPTEDAQAQGVLAEAEARLVDALERHADEFAHSINRLTESQFDKLDRAARRDRREQSSCPPSPAGRRSRTWPSRTCRGRCRPVIRRSDPAGP